MGVRDDDEERCAVEDREERRAMEDWMALALFGGMGAFVVWLFIVWLGVVR